MSNNKTPSPNKQTAANFFKNMPEGLRIKRLNNVPVLIGVVFAVLAVGAVSWSISQRSKSTRPVQQASEQQAEDADGQMAAVLRNAPKTGEIPASMQKEMADARSRGGVAKPDGRSAQDTRSAKDQTGQTVGQGQKEKGPDLAAEARQNAWRVYYQQLAALQQERFQAEQNALKAETSSPGQLAAGGSGGPSPIDQKIADAQTAANQAQNAVSGATPVVAGGTVVPGVAAGGFGAGGYPVMAPAEPDKGAAREKQAFINQTGNLGQNDTLGATVRDAISPYLVTAGDVIPCIAQGGEDSDTPGQFVGRVSRNIYDSATGRYLLIPQNAKVIGTYDNVVTNGQTRIPTVITRIIFPDSSSIPLGAMPAADRAGYAGLHDQVDTHLWEKFGNAAILAVGSAGIQMSQGTGQNANGYNAQQIGAAAIGQQFGELGEEYARAGLTIPNTLRIRNGYNFVIQITKDIVLRPYADKRAIENQNRGN